MTMLKARNLMGMMRRGRPIAEIGRMGDIRGLGNCTVQSSFRDMMSYNLSKYVTDLPYMS